MQVRKYRPEDRDAVRAICKATAVPSFCQSDKKGEQVCWLFLDYFLDYEPEHALVAVEDERVVGYVCGSLDGPRFQEKMRSVYDQKIRKSSFVLFLFSRLCSRLTLRLYPKYGCPLHMNVAPAFQHRGIGVALLNALKKHCGEHGGKGLFLVTKNRGTTGYPFYRSQGFQERRDFLFGSLVLAFPLAETTLS